MEWITISFVICLIYQLLAWNNTYHKNGLVILCLLAEKKVWTVHLWCRTGRCSAWRRCPPILDPLYTVRQPAHARRPLGPPCSLCTGLPCLMNCNGTADPAHKTKEKENNENVYSLMWHQVITHSVVIGTTLNTLRCSKVCIKKRKNNKDKCTEM